MTLPDVPWCTELSQNDGVCYYWLSKKTVRVDNTPNPKTKLNGKNWTALKSQGAVCPADDCYVKLKKFMKNFCHQNKKDCPPHVGDW